MKSVLVVMAVALMLPVIGLTQSQYSYKIDQFLTSSPRYLGDEHVGTINSVGLRLYIDNPQIHSQLFGFEYEEHYNRISSSSSLMLPEQRFAYGFNLNTSEHCNIKVAGSQEQFMNDDDFSSFGIYPNYKRDWGGLEFGYEADLENTEIYLFQGTWNKVGTIFYGASHEDFQEGHYQIEQMRHNRFGVAWLINPIGRFQFFAGGNYNPDLERPDYVDKPIDQYRTTWMGGFAHYVDLSSGGINPGLMIVRREKPSSSYTLGIFTLWGRGLNEHVTEGIYDAFSMGGYKRSRINGGKYMGDPGLGSAYEMQDFGRVSLAWSSLSVNTGETAVLMSDEFTAYFTHPKSLGPVVNPYVGVTWTRFSDLVFDMNTYQLNDPDQEYLEFKVGGKLKLWPVDDPRQKNQLGYLRLNVSVNMNGGMGIKSSLWF